MPVDFPAILGRDVSGEVTDTGSDVTGFHKGMRVMAMANGAYAEYTTVRADTLAPIPDALSQPDASRLYELADDVARGEFTIPVAQKFPLDQARKAHYEAEFNHPDGKILLVA